MITCNHPGCPASISGGTKAVNIQIAERRGWKSSPKNGWKCPVHSALKAQPCATYERQNCDADATGKCPITGEEADDGYNTVGEGDHLL